MAELLRRTAEATPDRIAVEDDRSSVTWAELDRRVNRLIHGLRDAGIRPGDTVVLLSRTRLEFVEAVLAISHTGIPFVPLNWHVTAEEAEYVVRDSGAVAILVDEALVDLAAEVTASVDGMVARIVFGDAGTSAFVAYETLLAASSEAEPEAQQASFPIFYTSGTTGRPKGVESSQATAGMPIAALDAAMTRILGLFGAPSGATVLVNSPLYHTGPFGFATMPLFTGGTVILRDKFSAAGTLALIDEANVNIFYSVPTHFSRLLNLSDEERAAFDGSSLEYVFHSGAPCPVPVKQRMIEWWGPVIVEYYGATEGPAHGTLITSEEWLAKPGSVGRATPMGEIVILDDDGAVLPAGDVGQVFFRSAVDFDFRYRGAPEKTEAAHHDGMFSYGDVGRLDEDGYLYLTDRKIDMIVSGGVNIYPAEVENAIITHPDVVDVAVFGIPDDELGEQVKAVVELRAGAEPSADTEQAIIDHVKAALSGYKAPKSVEFRDRLPRAETGKLMKRLLRDPYWEGAQRSI